MNRRVVITGLGVVTSIGIGKDEFWNNLIAGKSGIRDVSEFHAANYPLQKGGPVGNFCPKNEIPESVGRASQFAIEGTLGALSDAHLSVTDIAAKKTGVIFGTTNGEATVLEEIDRIWLEKGEDEVWAQTILKYPLDSISRNVASFFNICNIAQMIPTACSAGNYSIGYAYDLIKTGRLDVMIAGGSDPLTRYAFAGFGRLFAMAPHKCQPFDKNRKGMMIGEGAGVLILETLESAKKRDANIYAEILGYGLSCDAHHMTAPRVEGIAKVIDKAVCHSGVKKEDVGYICAHGTGTLVNDKTECEAIKRVFGKAVKNILISSIKSMLGHTMGAASAIEAVACCLAIKESMLPPTINFENRDPECDIDCIPNKAREKDVRVVLNNSFAFGGNNACVVFGKYGN